MGKKVSAHIHELRICHRHSKKTAAAAESHPRCSSPWHTKKLGWNEHPIHIQIITPALSVV